MDENVNATDRSPRDYLLFALAFVGFGISLAGVVLASPFLAVSGLLLLLFALSCFELGAED